EEHYYPFGLSMAPLSFQQGTPNRYRYNGKELHTELGLGWYDYGFRWYDPAVARWNGVDALVEEFMAWSPYNYTLGNPIRFIDPDGRSPWKPIGNGQWQAEDGDSAHSLARDANISLAEADQIVQSQLGSNYIRESDGMLMSDVEVGDVVQVREPFTFGSKGSVEELLNTQESSYKFSPPQSANSTLDGISGLGTGMVKQGGSIRLTNGVANGNAFSPKFYQSGWTGGSRARISTYNLGTLGKSVGRLGTGGAVIMGGLDITVNAYKEGGFGQETQKATGRTVGSLGGGWGGATLGAYIGSHFLGVGAIPGGIVGGILGGWGGSEVGEAVAEEIQE
ncbi:MAG: RHS repeat-associated core domain-containing protein, partial [Bacteroidota bacterium]